MLALLVALLIVDVIGHFVEYDLEANFVIGRRDRSARVGSVLSETR